jgi:hypothetical protein
MNRGERGGESGGPSAGAMIHRMWRIATLLVALVVVLAAAGAQAAPASKKARSHHKEVAPPPEPKVEPKATDILKAASARLAAAHSLAFTAVISYESPSRYGPPLVYTTRSEVAVQRPDKLRVITPGDGPASDFYYDGKTMTAYAPFEGLVAIADAPPTIDATLKAAYDKAAIYFPFTDVIVADPYADIADGLKLAFYIGQCQTVGGVTTDMVAYASADVFVQAWIGADDKLPRRLRAVYRNDPLQLRHEMDLSHWQLDSPLPAEAFTLSIPSTAKRIEFARPDPIVPEGIKPPPKHKPAKSKR